MGRSASPFRSPARSPGLQRLHAVTRPTRHDVPAVTRRPRYILRQPLSEIDGRNPAFDPPATQLAMECRSTSAANSVWQLLARQSDRCGPLRPLGSVTTGLGHWVTVPSAPAGDVVVATFSLSDDLWSRFESLLFKPPNVFLAANDDQETWRFVAATGPDLHVLRASSALGFPRVRPRADSQPPFLDQRGEPGYLGRHHLVLRNLDGSGHPHHRVVAVPTITSAGPALRTPASSRPSLFRGAFVVHMATLAAAGAFLVYDATKQWFYLDEWDFLVYRGIHLGRNGGLFAPHNEHWTTIPILIWRACSTWSVYGTTGCTRFR